MPPAAAKIKPGFTIDVVALPSAKSVARAVRVLTMPRAGDVVAIRGAHYKAAHALHTFRPGDTPRITLYVRRPPDV